MVQLSVAAFDFTAVRAGEAICPEDKQLRVEASHMCFGRGEGLVDGFSGVGDGGGFDDGVFGQVVGFLRVEGSGKTGDAGFDDGIV